MFGLSASPSQVLGLLVHISTQLQGEISKIFSGSNILSLQVSAVPDECWTTAGRANFKQNRPLDWHEILKHFIFLMFGEVSVGVVGRGSRDGLEEASALSLHQTSSSITGVTLMGKVFTSLKTKLEQSPAHPSGQIPLG